MNAVIRHFLADDGKIVAEPSASPAFSNVSTAASTRVLDVFQQELQRVAQFFEAPCTAPRQLFAALTHPREAIIRFANDEEAIRRFALAQ